MSGKKCAEFMIGNNISAHQRATKETPFSSEWPPEVRIVLERALTVLEEVLDSATTQEWTTGLKNLQGTDLPRGIQAIGPSNSNSIDITSEC